METFPPCFPCPKSNQIKQLDVWTPSTSSTGYRSEMLNRQLSSSSSKSKNEKKKNKKSPRSPLRDLNGIDCSRRSTSSIASSSSSSMSVVEVSRGCLRFLLPTSSASKKTPLGRSKPNKTTPKSAPNAKPSNPSFSFRSTKPLKENAPKPKSEKEKKLTKTPHFSQNGKKKPSSEAAQEPRVDESGESPKILQLPDSSVFVENSTPVGKLECGSGLVRAFDDKLAEEDSNTKTDINRTKTPPVQASVSPEIQCGPPSMLLVSAAATPACYGAGHIVSGVTDRRKCRAKGILTVGETDSNFAKANIFDNCDDVEICSKPRASLVPLPAEASMHWLLSPCDEDQKSDVENGLHHLRKSFESTALQCISSPSSGHRLSCKGLENTSSTSASSRRRAGITLLSPSGSPAYHGTPTREALISREKRIHRYDLAREDSPFSVDPLGSGNVIQTPQSDLSSDRHVRLSWLNSHHRQNHDLGSGIDSLEEVLLRASLSPKAQISIWDSPGLNFQISDLISPSNSIDLMRYAKKWDNHASCTSNSSLGDLSQSRMRISWREGLVSRIFEMDEFDCCRCLSDDENDAIDCSDGKLKCSPNHELNVNVGSAAVHGDGFGSSHVFGHEPKSNGEPKEKFPEQRPNPCAESICIDGGGLFASADSDWTLCYKNQLFEL